MRRSFTELLSSRAGFDAEPQPLPVWHPTSGTPTLPEVLGTAQAVSSTLEQVTDVLDRVSELDLVHRSIGSTRSWGSLWSHRSLLSALSSLSALSVGSFASLASAGSVGSIASAGSVLSIGSAGSVLSVGAAGGFCSIGARTVVRPETAATVLAAAALLSAGSSVSRRRPRWRLPTR